MNLFIDQLYWRQPLWLLLVLFPVLLMWWRMVRQRHSLRNYAEASLLPWVMLPNRQRRNYWQTAAQLLIWLLLGMAAAGPRLMLFAPQKLLPSQGAAVIVIDYSRSMLARDVFPDRLQQAHDAVKQWVGQAHKFKLGLVIFAGKSHVVLPPTADKQALAETVSLLNEIQLPTYGTALVDALKQAKSLLHNASGSRAIILLTDGDVSSAALAQVQTIGAELHAEKISLHLLGVGTPSPVALHDENGRWLKYKGKTVITRLKETALQALAENKGVTYSRLTPILDNQLSNVWQPPIARIAARHRDQVLWKELFPWCLIPALLLIIINHLSIPRLVLPVAGIMVIIGLMLPQISQAGERNTLPLAYKAWQNGNYITAEKYYAQVEGYAARMGEGASCFRGDRIPCAIAAFSRAAWLATSDKQRGRAAFNLGNSFFKQGDFKSAITLYKDALRYQPQQRSYRKNLSISEAVQQNIEDQKAEYRRRLQATHKSLNQSGLGQRAAPVNEDNKTVSTMNSTKHNRRSNQPLKSQAISLTEAQLALYMQRSQHFASLKKSQGRRVQHQHDWGRFTNKAPTAARKVKFWQRLFELDDGILVHRNTPETLPGVRPW